MRSLYDFKNNKKGWMRIVEAFIAIMLIMTVMLVVISRQRVGVNTATEIEIRQKNILSLITSDDVLRSEILAGKLIGTNNKVRLLVPAAYNYSIRLCLYTDICGLNFTVPGEVYSQETLVVANLTYYNPAQAVKLKLFFWKGAYPPGNSPPNYSAIITDVLPTACTPSCAGKVCGDNGCGGSCGPCNSGYSCVSGACVPPTSADISVSNWITSAPYSWLNPADGVTYQRINWSITISNNNPILWVIKNGTTCWARVASGNLCTFLPFTDNSRNSTYGSPYIKDSYSYTTNIPNTYNVTYVGQDLNGHIFSVFKEVHFS